MNILKTNIRKTSFGVLLCFAGLTALAASPGDQEKLASANTGFAFDFETNRQGTDEPQHLYLAVQCFERAANGGQRRGRRYQGGNAAGFENDRPAARSAECSVQGIEPVPEFADERDFESGQCDLVSGGDPPEARVRRS